MNLNSLNPGWIPLDLLTTCSQFINDKFLYNHTLAMEMLVQSGLKEQLLELAKVLAKLILYLKFVVLLIHFTEQD